MTEFQAWFMVAIIFAVIAAGVWWWVGFIYDVVEKSVYYFLKFTNRKLK